MQEISFRPRVPDLKTASPGIARVDRRDPIAAATCGFSPGTHGQCDSKRNCGSADCSTQSRGVGLSALRTAVASGTVRGLSLPQCLAGELRSQDRHHQRRPRGDVALRGDDAHRGGRLGPSSLAANAAADVLLAQGSAERPRRVPRRRPLRDEFPARAGRSRGLSGPFSRNWPKTACGRACSTSSTPAAAWPWER